MRKDGLDTYQGPRRQVSVRLSAETVLTLELAAAAYGVSRHDLVTRLLERWAREWEKASEA